MTELKDAVNAAKARSGEVVHRPQTAFDAVRRNVDVLRIIGLDPCDPKSHAVVAVCDRYGLDAVLGHIMLLGNSRLPYVTRDGYVFIAHRSGQLDGLAVEDPHREGNQWVTHASVWRKDMSRPFVYPGSAEVGRDNAQEMAIARAERRALKRAFAVTLPREFAEDEFDSRAQPTPTPPAAAPGEQPDTDASPGGDTGGASRAGGTTPPGEAPPPVEAEDQPEDYWDQPAVAKQVAAIHATLRELGITDRTERLALFSDVVGHPVRSTKELTLGEAESVLVHLRDRQHASTEPGSDDQGSDGDE